VNKKVKKIFDPNINNQSNYINNSSIGEELKIIQRSIALLRQDLPNIIHDALVRSSKLNRG
jgi:hypothetical protein